MIRKLENFVEELATMEVPTNVYNQYSYKYKENQVRRENLRIYLKKMAEIKPQVIFIGEAPGYRGCRLTGVPFTSEDLLMNNIKGLQLFGREAGYRLEAEKDKLFKEATASIMWETFLKYNIIPLGWNAFPFHPHKEGMPESNRTPLQKELFIGEGPLLQMLEIFNIKQVVAVGRKSEGSLKRLNISAHQVRHPAQGGKNQFVEGVAKLANTMN